MSPPAAPGSYPGNASLPAEVREKILATFRHALNLFSSGNVSDCVIGCEFILKMDPRFTPAQKLRDKARNRESDVDIAELRALVTPPQPGSPAPIPPPPAPVRAAAPPPPPERRAEKADSQRLLAEAEQKCDARDYDGAMAAASRVLTLVPGDKDALAMIEKAAGKKAMQSLIESIRFNAEEALTQGRIPAARREVERLRATDPRDPALSSLERRLSAVSEPVAPAPADPGSVRPETDEFSLGGPQGEGYGATPAFGDFSSEPANLDPFPAPSPDFPPAHSEGAAPQVENAGFFGFDDTPPGADTVAPSPLAPRDMFLPTEETSGAAGVGFFPSSEIDEQEVRDTEREIAALLKQGDETAKKGDREQAIEIWSRVFLIDINNSEAVTRIEQARQEIADDSRMVAECLKKGREAFEAGNREAARDFFLQAQSLDSREPTAALYLERIETGEGDKPSPVSGGSAPARPAAGAMTEALPDTPARMPAPAAAPPPRERPAGLPINARVLALIGAFLALTLVGAYFVFKGKGTHPPPPQKSAASGSVQHARELLDRGQNVEARAELRRIRPNDPEYEEARKLLASPDKGGAPEGGKAVRPGVVPSDSKGESDSARVRAVAEKALGEKRYIDALKNFNLAAPAFRDDPSFAQEQGLASEKVTAITPAVKFYNEGEYETAIPILWRIVQEDRDNQDARSYLLRSYYNQGISQLQNGLYPKAIQAFREVVSLDPNDSEAGRHLKFAERYQKGDLDLLGRIYVHHLDHRR